MQAEDFSANRSHNEDRNKLFTDIQRRSPSGDKCAWNLWNKLTTGHVKVHPPGQRTNGARKWKQGTGKVTTSPKASARLTSKSTFVWKRAKPH